MNRWGRAAAAAITAVPLVIAAASVVRTAAASDPNDTPVPSRLSETGLYVSGRPGVVDARNRPFSPQYPLWSDGATKARWVYLPPGAAIDGAGDGDWEFPVNTRFWKEFTFNGRKIETRLLWKATAARWVAVSYRWNDEQTDATLAPRDGLVGVAEIATGRRHTIPSTTDCLACHGTRRTGPLGFNALQLSTDRDPNAIHGEPLTAGMVTLKTLVDERLLAPPRKDLLANPPRIHASTPRARAVLGYLAANCGTCHNANGEIAVSGPSLKHSDIGDGDAVARSLIGSPTAWSVPGVPMRQSVLIDPRAPEQSALVVRMRSRQPSSQMPPLGTVMRDHEAVEAVLRWIRTDLATVDR